MNDKDLIGKADGLMRRASPLAGTETVPVPVLTDFIDPLPSPAPPGVEAVPTETDEITARVTRHVEQRLEEEMQRVRREIARSVAEAVREALANRPVK